MPSNFPGTLDGKSVSFCVSEKSIDFKYSGAEDVSLSIPLENVITALPPPTPGHQHSQDGDPTLRILLLQGDDSAAKVHLRTLEVTEALDALEARLPCPAVHPAHLNLNADVASNIHVVISTHSGTHAASSFFKNALKPLLSRLRVTDYQVHETQSAETIIELSRAVFLPKAQAGQKQTIILLSGDGGLVDIIRVFSGADENARRDDGCKFVAPRVSLIPMGTGNATANSTGLFTDATWGLSTLVRGEPRKLPLFRVALSPGSVYLTDEGRQREPISRDDSGAEIYGAVVLSWCMHASLVADSDTAKYREFGAERFQMAAKELLYPSDGSATHQYRGRVTLIKRDPVSGREKEEVVSREEHMYVLVTLMSQLEKEFTISPLSQRLDGQLRIVHFGPVSPDEAMALMGKASQGGKHVEDELVGYEAVEGVRIQFDEDDERWRRICVDGKVAAVERGGWLGVRGLGRELLQLIVKPEGEQSTL